MGGQGPDFQASDLESVSLVKRNGSRMRDALDRSGVISMAVVETACHQLATDSLPLQRRIEAKPRQVPSAGTWGGRLPICSRTAKASPVLVRRHRLG